MRIWDEDNPDHISESLETIFWVKILLNSLMRIRDPGWKKFGRGRKTLDPGCLSRIRNTGGSTSVFRGTTFTKSPDLDQGILVNPYPESRPLFVDDRKLENFTSRK